MAWPSYARRRQFAREVDRIAGSIPDPICRLRFLRATALESAFMGSRHGRIRRWMLWPALLLALLIPFVITIAAGKPAALHPRRSLPRGPAASQAAPSVPVWQVERTTDSEVYSNGLRIDTRYMISNRPRSYLAFPRAAASRDRRYQPAGIIYHTTESCQAPFEAAETPAIKLLGESLLEYVRRQRAYHYLIDRFGRVYRVVAETDVAYHAGRSVWADEQWFYVDLNSSFLGISFEAQTNPGHAGEIVNPAQVRAAAVLTEMLRSRYGIPPENCITHAQVSVNSSNMLVGYHTDWAEGFPYRAVGLPDNYQRALPAVWAFGFGYEAVSREARGMSPGIELAEDNLARAAAASGTQPEAYRKKLRKRYLGWLAEVCRKSPLVTEVRSLGR